MEIASRMLVEEAVGVVYEAVEHGYHFFQMGERGGMLRGGISCSLWWGV